MLLLFFVQMFEQYERVKRIEFNILHCQTTENTQISMFVEIERQRSLRSNSSMIIRIVVDEMTFI